MQTIAPSAKNNRSTSVARLLDTQPVVAVCCPSARHSIKVASYQCHWYIANTQSSSWLTKANMAAAGTLS